MNISSLIQIINNALERVKTKLTQIPGLFLVCTCSRRPGFSSLIASSKIYADMDQNEYDDVVKAFVYNLVDKIKRNMQDDGVCFVAIKPNELQLQLTGGNGGGPIVLNGSNKNYVFTWAIIR